MAGLESDNTPGYCQTKAPEPIIVPRPPMRITDGGNHSKSCRDIHLII